MKLWREADAASMPVSEVEDDMKVKIVIKVQFKFGIQKFWTGWPIFLLLSGKSKLDQIRVKPVVVREN